MKLWPVVGVVGARQTGKSTLLRDILTPTVRGDYVTLDSLTQRGRAEKSPEAFSQPPEGGGPLIIDEMQKAPDLFDAIKLHVDKRRRPGTYVISGSTEFSRFTGVRESLTGRIAILQLHPMILSELHGEPFGAYYLGPRSCRSRISLSEFEKKLDRGGMPGMCFLREDRQFGESWDAWLETTCFRDLSQIRGGKFDGELAIRIVSEVARSAEPTAHVVARALRRDTRVVSRYLDALCRIFVVRKLNPHAAGVGKPHYLLCDSGLVRHLNAPRENILRTHLVTEALATVEYGGLNRPRVEYYRNEKISRIPLVLTWTESRKSPPPLAIRFYDGESPSRGDLASLTAFRERTSAVTRLLLLTQTSESYKEGPIEVHPLRG